MPSHAAEPGRIVVACGGFRSGSTLQYNLLGEYVERLQAGRRVGYITPPEAAHLRQSSYIVDALGLPVAKSHDLARGFHDWGGMDEAWREWHRDGRLVAVYCVRDFRHVVASMSRKFSIDPVHVLGSKQWSENVANMEAWLELSPLVQRYEEFTARPRAALREMAQHVGLAYKPLAARQAARAAGLARMKRVASQLPDGTWDARTLVHWDHIDNTSERLWQGWPAQQRAAIEQELTPLLRRFGYPMPVNR